MTTKPNPLAAPLLVQTAPERIWLQIDDGAYAMTEAFPDEATSEITWCSESVVESEVKYVRADLVAELVAAARDVENGMMPFSVCEGRMLRNLRAALARFGETP